jgi:hypothetical protein
MFQHLFKQLHLGRVLYLLYFQPKGFLEQCVRKGAFNMAIDAYARNQMAKAAYHLSTIPPSSAAPLDLYFLTGRKFWDQTCLCAYSFAQHSPIPIRPIIYDDGSLTKFHRKTIQRIFPTAQFFSKLELDDRIHTHLPTSKFPYLNERRQNYPNIRKLTDIHIGSTGWKLVLDSDMLFFRTPNTLLNWLQNPQQPCHMVDVETSYGYPDEFMQALAGAPIADRINVGICGLQSEAIDWEQLEYWCKTMIETYGTHYYQEQALIAMLMAGKSCMIASEQDYIVMPDRIEVTQPKAILHHYVADSKPWYFRYGWKHTQSYMSTKC